MSDIERKWEAFRDSVFRGEPADIQDPAYMGFMSGVIAAFEVIAEADDAHSTHAFVAKVREIMYDARKGMLRLIHVRLARKADEFAAKFAGDVDRN